MRATAGLLVVTLAAGENGHTHKCTVEGPMDSSSATSSSKQLELPVPGKEVCQALRDHCGSGRQGAMCVKAALETILPDDRHVDAIRSSMHVGPDFYFLCTGPGVLGRPAGTERVTKLTEMFSRAISQGLLETRPQMRQEPTHADTDYRLAARWSELANWTVEEKVEHFVRALEMLPDNPHCIDRLAVALGEAGDASLGGSPAPPAAVLRGMLLHYAVLRNIIVHPLQRPLALTPGLTARPFWDVGSLGSDDTPWLAVLVTVATSHVRDTQS